MKQFCFVFFLITEGVRQISHCTQNVLCRGEKLLPYFKSTNDHQRMDVEPGNVQADLLQQFAWKSSSGKPDKLFSKK